MPLSLVVRKFINIRAANLAITLAIIGFATAPSLRADTIVGPPLPRTDDGGFHYGGIGFTATVDSTLTSFLFWNQGLADTVELVDPNGNILFSVPTAAGNTLETISVNWALTAGQQYYLLQSTFVNARYDFWGLPAPFDRQIALTDTGVFSQGLPISDFFFYGGPNGADGTRFWVAFTDITTASAVPEPAAWTLVLTGMLVLSGYAARNPASHFRL